MDERKIVVGLFVLLMMLIVLVCIGLKFIVNVIMYVLKILNCVVVLINISLGFEINVEKFVIVLIFKKISGGYYLEVIFWYKILRIEFFL